jgi:hypothetical protein
MVPSIATMLDRWRWTPPPKIQTPAAFASRTTACANSPTAGQSCSGIWFIEPSSNEIKYRGIALLLMQLQSGSRLDALSRIEATTMSKDVL